MQIKGNKILTHFHRINILSFRKQASIWVCNLGMCVSRFDIDMKEDKSIVDSAMDLPLTCSPYEGERRNR